MKTPNASEPIHIYGKHTVKEALTFAPHCIISLFVREDTVSFLGEKLLKKVSDVRMLTGNVLPKGVDRHAVHQGVIALIDSQKLIVPYTSFISKMSVTDNSSLVVLAEVQDPHNVGAVIRASAAFGISGVLIPKHDQAQFSATVAKVSAGMAFKVPLVDVGNVNRTLDDLKKRGFFVYGLAGEGETLLNHEQFTKPTVFVLGNEGYGLRKMTREHCDTILSIPMHPQCESLNASASASIAFYAWSVQHPL